MNNLKSSESVSLGEFVRIHRKRLKLSQQALADKAGISRGCVVSIEKDGDSVGLESLQKVLDVLGYGIKVELVDDEEN